MVERYRLTIDGGTDKAFTKEYTKEEYEAKKDYITNNYQGRYQIDVIGDADTSALDDNATYTVRIDDADFSKDYTGKELKSKMPYFNANYADRFRVETAKPVPVRSAKEELDAFYQENGAFLEDFEKRDSLDLEEAANAAIINEGISFFKPKNRISKEERAKYNELSSQRKALEKAWYTSDEYLSQQDAKAYDLAQTQKELLKERNAYNDAHPYKDIPGAGLVPINAAVQRTTGDPEVDSEKQMYDIAARINEETIKLHNAPSKYGNNSGLRNMGIGAKDKATDPALWSAGLTKITDDLGVRDVLAKIQKEKGNLNDLSEEAIEDILTPAEKAVLKAWARNAQEQMERQGNLSLGYQAGQGAVESLMYMAEFALTGGVGELASEGVEGMAKWLAKNAYKVSGLADDAAEVAVRELGEKVTKNALGKYGAGLVKSLAETAGKTMVMPSTYKNIVEKATEIQKDEDGNSYLVEMNDAFAEGYVDSFIENLSEGGRVNAIGELVGGVAGKIPVYKKIVDKFSKTKASELLTMLNSTGVMNTLRAGGWHGFGEEYLEEWYGNALRTILGVDKDALKNFATLDNQMVTLASFLPITIFGGTVSTGQVLSAKRDLDKKAETLRTALLDRGYSEAQADNMIDMMRGATPSEVSGTLSPIITKVAGRDTNEARELAKPAMEFAWAVSRYQSYGAKYEYQQQGQRDGLRAEMEQKLGKFWMEDENGRQTVQRGVNEKGEVVYLLGKQEVEDVQDGLSVAKEVAAINSEGKPVFVFPSDYQLEDELEMNDFLATEIMAEKGNQEQARKAQERDIQVAEIKQKAAPGTTINIGTVEAPVMAEIAQRGVDGVIVTTQSGEVRQIGYVELGKYLDVNTDVYSDAELDEQEADALSADRSQREAALDQEYDNDAEAIEELAEAEQEIEQSIEAVTPLPTKEDGSVDQNALWNNDPERWAQWNDEQRQDGGANSLAYVSGAIAKEQAKIAELQAAYEAESDFDKRDAIEKELTNVRERILRLDAIRQNYIAQAEAQTQSTQQQTAQPVQPAPQLTEEEKAALEEERRKPLRAKAKELSEKLGVKVKLAEDLSDVQESKAREQLLKSAVSNGKQKVAGWYNQATGEVTIFLPHAESVEDVEKTFIHEVVAHKGLRGLLGEEGFNVFCDAVWDMMSESDRNRFINYPGVNGDKRAAADEYMAHFAETLNLEEAKPDMWERIVAIIKQILDSMGVRLRINQEGLSSVIAASYQKLLADAKAAQETANTTYQLSDEVDENGRQFVLASNGEIAFGEISSDTGLTPAPILLSEGMITNSSTNDGYGLVHIEARHGDQIRKAGYNSVVEFIEEVAKNYEVIREGKNRGGIQTYMLQLTDKHNNTLMVELSGDGTYWNINTAGIFKTSYGANRKEVYNRHTTDKQSAETVGVSQVTEQSGTQPTSSMNTPTSSEDKVSNNNVNSNAEENLNLRVVESTSPLIAAAQQEGESIRFSITTEESLQEKIRNFAKTKEGKATKWSEDDIESIIAETESLIDAIHKSSTGNEFYDEFAYKEPTIRVDWRDGEAKPIVTWTRANIEYKYDMSADLLCINNEGLEQVLSSDKMVALMEMFVPEKKAKKGEPEIKFTSEDYLELYNTLKDLGFVVPCKGCFDAAGRFKMLPSVAQKFATEVNAVIDERNKDPKAFDDKLKAKSGEKTIDGLPTTASTKSAAIAVGVAGDNLTEHVKWTQLMSADGQTKMLSDWGGIFRAWQRTGAGRPKDKLLPEPYYGDIVSSVSTIIGKYGEKTPSFRDILVNQGTGLRRNSHSEFRPVLAIDEIQFMRDAFIRNLTVFKYMKELDDVRLFGKMGVKFNMSFFPEYVPGTKVAGLDKDGNYIASEESVGSREFPYQGEDGKRHYDGMKGWVEAQKHINKDVSLSSVIFSIPHLLKALTDVPTPSDMRGIWGSLIPFHSSGATTASLAMQGLGMSRANGVGHGFIEAFSDYGKGVTNFEAVQNDRFGEGWYIVSGKKAGENVEPGHKLEFANGNHYYNQALGVHLFASGYILDSELPEGALAENGELNITDQQKKALMHNFTVDYNDKVRELKGPYAYKDAADYYISELPKLGLIPRFDFEVSEEKFLEMCEAANVDPRHPKLGWKGEGNSWSPIDSEAYYSLFCDYGMTDPTTGEWAPHMPVGYVNEEGQREFRLPENAVEIVKEGLDRFSEVRRSESAKIDKAIETFAERSVEKGRISQKNVDKVLGKKSAKPKQSGVIDLVEEAKKSDLRHRITAERTLVPGHKKGQPMLSDAEMMADVSFRVTKNTEATIRSWCKKAGAEDFADNLIGFLDWRYEDTTEQLCAAKWFLAGKINLPEDDYKVEDAVKVAKQNKVDALSYASPMDILNHFGPLKKKEKAIDPDTVREFTNKQVLAEGIVVYDVQDDFEGQAAVRKIIDTHWGEDANPWCLAARTNGDLERAKEMWLHYSKYPKRIAFRNGKLLAFFASHDDKTWWDRNDEPHTNIPYSVKSKEGDYEVSTNYELKEGNKKATQVSVGKSDGKGKTAYFVGNRLESAGIQDGERNLFYSSFAAGATLSDSTYGVGRSIEIQYGPYKNVTQIYFERRTEDEPAYSVRVGYGQNGVRAISFVEGARSWDIRYGINGDQIFVKRVQLNFDLTNELSDVYYDTYHMYRINDEEYEIARGTKKVGIVKKGEKVTMQMLEAFGKDGAPVGALLDFINDMGWNRSDYPYPNPADADLLRRDDEVREQIRKVENEINEIAGGRYLSSVPAIRFRTVRTDEQREQLFDNAKEKFGLTNNFKVAGYMLPDGSLLDFSEANDGGDPNQRTQDHREVADLIMDEGREYEYRYEYVLDFVGEGAIRMLPEYAGFQLSVPPTAEQRSRLMDYIYKYDGEVIMEITDENGGPRVYMEYNKRTSPSRIFRDMDGFFNEGIVPGIPPLRFRIANDNQAIFVSNAAKAVEGIKQEKATPEQWLKMIEKNGGLKAGEDKWMGLSDWLKASDKKTLTKQEVLDFINENMIIIEEQHYSSAGVREEADRILNERYPGWEDAFSFDWDPFMEEPHSDIYDEVKAVRLYNETHEDQVETDEDGDIINDADYDKVEEFGAELAGIWYGRGKENTVREINGIREDYTTSGLTNLHEIALTVPTIKPWNIHDETHFGDAGGGRAVAWIRFGDTQITEEGSLMEYEPKSDVEREIKNYIEYAMRNGDDFETSVGYAYNQITDAPQESVGWTEEAVTAVADGMRGKEKVRKVLVIDEVQSKRHQEGREKGYRTSREDVAKATEAFQSFNRAMKEKYGENVFPSKWSEEDQAEFDRLRDEHARVSKSYDIGVPDAPFDKNWHELAMKRMLRYAAENGYDVVAWTTGDQQADRYDLSRDVKKISASKPTKDGERIVNIYYRDEYNDFKNLVVDKEGKVVQGDYSGNALADVIGKEMALQIMKAEESTEFKGEGLKIGGEGMRGFYDKMLPSFMNKYGKKWGVKVEDIDLPNLGKSGRTMHSVPVTEEMKASVMEGQVMFHIREEGESAMDFHQSVVDEFSSAFNPVAEIQVYPVNEETAKKLGYTLKELQETYGDYDKENDIISIFAHEDVTNSIDVESTIFHESIHKNQAHFGGFTKIGDWMLDMAEINDVFAEYREIVRENYTEDKHSEEMLCLMLGDIMALRKAFEFMAIMPEDIQGICEDLLNQLDYDKSREKTARVLGLVEGRSDSSTSIPAKRKASKGSWRKTEAKGALTAEERRIIGEYFPEFNKSEDVRMRVNSQGKVLTEGQKEFFANSKAVDKDGNLLVLYHGTPRAGFTEFKSGWFTTSKEDAISYSGDRKGRLFDPDEKYEPETLTAGDSRLGYMTFDSEEDRAAFLERFPYADEVMSEREYEDARMGAEDEEYDALTARRKEFAEVWNAYREYERERFVDTPIADLVANPEAYTEEDLMRAMLEYDSNASLDSLDDMSAEERKDALVSALQNANEETEGGILDMVIPTRVPRNGEGLKHNDLGNRTYEVYANVENPYEIDANGRGSEFESGDIYKAVEEALADEQYDGVIIRNWRVGRTQQLGDVVVPKNGSQIKLTSNENPTESSDIRFRTSLELDEEFGDAWRNQQNEDGRHSTQVANTKSTYEKIGHYLEDAGMKGASILDASSGLGLGTQALREMGFQVDDVEPFPSENREAPTFSSYADIDGKYDVVISNAVLNVIPDDWRADVLHQMADAVKEGGKMIINTRPASNIAQQGVEGKTRITLDSPSEILVKRGDRIAAYQKGFTSEELAEWIKSELGEGWRVEKATKKNSGISGEGTAVVIKEGDDVSFRTTGTPTDEVVANGLQLTSAQTAEVAANIFAALPEESRKKITEGLNGNILGLKNAILQIPASLASKENWNEEDKQMADVVAEEMTKMAGEMTRPFSAEEGLWLLYNNLNKGTDLISQASRALVQRNLGFDAETLAKQDQAKEDVRFRTVGDATSNAQASLYNRGAVNVWTRLKESFVDMQASVEELVKAIEKRTGKIAQGFENILLALNQQSSKGLAAMESYTQKFLNPMFDEIRRIMDATKMKYEDVVRYVILKHGLERNKKLAQRDAKAHYQEIYDDIISKITGMTAAQKRTYLTNAQLKDGDAKAELATLQAVDMSAMTDEEKREHKKKLSAARKAVEEAEEHLKRAQKVASLSEQEAQDELDKIFEKIENGTDSVYKEMRENDYSGISSMFYDQLGVDRKNFSTEEQYQAALMEAKKDRYSSLKDIETAAEAEVKSFEGKTDTKELWKRINAATKETLRQQYEANMISKDQYLNLRDMFEYYVPLRGFKDNTAEDMYTYYRKPNSTGYTKPILGAEGRKTEAESPFGWIAAMAGSAIASNVKNEAKLALYYFVSNRPENGIATISKTWFVDSGEVDERGKKIFKPAYPPFSEDLSSDAAKASYEAWQENMRELQKKGQAYEAGQRLNLGNAVVNISDANKPEHIVNVKVGGKDYTIIINGNPRAAQAINGDLNIEGTAQDYSALFGPVLRWMSSVNTSYNPEFWITNMMRDMAFTWMAVNIKEDPAYRRKFSKNYRKAFKVISLAAKNENGTIGDSYLEQQYKDFVKYGGVTGYTQIKDSETWEKEIENYLSSNDPESVKNGKVMRGMKSAFHAAHRFGESLEQVSRFAAFLTARETGKSINEAINDAKEITVNFNRKGSGKRITLEEAKYLTGKNGQPLTKPQQWMVVGLSSIAPLGRRFIMFFNAAIQGLYATYKLMKKNPKRFIGWALGYAAVGMMNAVLHAMLDDDDDYLDIPQYERRNSLMIGGNGAYFKWALPQEARAFYALGDLAVETVMGRNPHQNFLGEALKIGTEVLPVNPSEGWKAFVPSVAIPAIELMINEDYKGAPIYNEQKWLSEEEKERTAKWSSAYQGTGWMYVKIAQGLNFITGGDKHDAGFINLQPEKLEYIVQSAFGGTIRTADKFINTISAAIDPEEPNTIRQAPFLNRFLTINDERFKNVHVNDVFDYYKADAEHALTLEKQYIKDRDMDSLTELRSSDEYQWAKIYGKYKKPLKAIQDKIKVADGTAEKKELMKQQDELKKRMIKQISEL